MDWGRPKYFPRPDAADAHGLVAITPDLSAELLLDAYRHGIFPWSENPVRWYSPDPRAIFLPQYLKLPKKLGKMMRKGGFRVTFDTAFDRVIRACSLAHADEGIWISDGFFTAYGDLHRRGYAHSVEVWQGDELAGGLYGVHIGSMYAGESMFYRASNASKVAFSFLIAQLEHLGVQLVDAQVINPHTARLGAVLVRRSDFLAVLRQVIGIPSRHEGERWPETPVAMPAGATAASAENA